MCREYFLVVCRKAFLSLVIVAVCFVLTRTHRVTFDDVMQLCVRTGACCDITNTDLKYNCSLSHRFSVSSLAIIDQLFNVGLYTILYDFLVVLPTQEIWEYNRYF